MQRLEQEVTAVDLQGAEAIQLYTTLLKAFPDYARNDQVLYQLARAPMRPPASPGRRSARWIGSCSATRKARSSMRVQFRRGELLFLRQALRGCRARLRRRHRARRRLGVLPARVL